jgi:hypothetical protein
MDNEADTVIAYRQRAVEVNAMAAATSDRGSRYILLGVASDYLSMADTLVGIERANRLLAARTLV